MKHLGTQTIETRRLILRRFTMDDVQPMFDNWARDPEVSRYLTWPPHSSTAVTAMVLTDWVEGYERADRYNWAVTLKEEGGAPIGNISVVCCDDDVASCEIGYCMGRAWWGRGIMSEALEAVIDYLIGRVGVNRVEARFDTNNPASGRVMARAGMTYEGIRRQAARNNQGIVDLSCYSILAEEWHKK